MAYRTIIALLLSSLLVPSTGWAEDFDVQIPMTRATSGSYHVEASFGGQIGASFLVDTGAGISVVEHDLLERLSEVAKVTLDRRIAARLANGKIQAVDVYKIDSFAIGAGCELGTLEVAVMQGSGNILGLNALEKLAPFALHISPTEPSLAVSHCGANQLASLN